MKFSGKVGNGPMNVSRAGRHFRLWRSTDVKYTTVVLRIAAWWCNGYDVGVATQKVAVRLPAVQVTTLGKLFTHTCDSVTKQYKLVPARRRRRPAAGKVTVGLASHWPCVTDFTGLSTYESFGLRKGDEYPSYTPLSSMVRFTFTMLRTQVYLGSHGTTHL